MTRELDVRESQGALAAEGARRLVDLGRAALAERGRFVLSVSGGATPAPLYDRLGEPGMATRLDWSRVYLFWGDDRWVPHDHPDSNVRLVREHWLARAPRPPGHVHPPPSGGPDPDRAARAYEATIRGALGVAPGDVPVFDLHVMGVGDDGHTASLFPGLPALDETERLVVAPFVPQVGGYRITLTLPVFNRAREVWMLVAGAHKAEVVRRVLAAADAPVGPDTPPAARIRPSQGRLVWLLDEAAAARLPDRLR
ncbi:MAG TPA: 6-phosphogluconolactonase [Thermodesulfobacteriota bacterium]